MSQFNRSHAAQSHHGNPGQFHYYGTSSGVPDNAMGGDYAHGHMHPMLGPQQHASIMNPTHTMIAPNNTVGINHTGTGMVQQASHGAPRVNHYPGGSIPQYMHPHMPMYHMRMMPPPVSNAGSKTVQNYYTTTCSGNSIVSQQISPSNTLHSAQRGLPPSVVGMPTTSVPYNVKNGNHNSPMPPSPQHLSSQSHNLTHQHHLHHPNLPSPRQQQQTPPPHASYNAQLQHNVFSSPPTMSNTSSTNKLEKIPITNLNNSSSPTKVCYSHISGSSSTTMVTASVAPSHSQVVSTSSMNDNSSMFSHSYQMSKCQKMEEQDHSSTQCLPNAVGYNYVNGSSEISADGQITRRFTLTPSPTSDASGGGGGYAANSNYYTIINGVRRDSYQSPPVVSSSGNFHPIVNASNASTPISTTEGMKMSSTCSNDPTLFAPTGMTSESVNNNKMNVNKLEGTISAVLNLALSNDPHNEVFSLIDKKVTHPLVTTPAGLIPNQEFKVPGIQHQMSVPPHVMNSTAQSSEGRFSSPQSNSSLAETLDSPVVSYAMHSTASPLSAQMVGRPAHSEIPSSMTVTGCYSKQLSTTSQISPSTPIPPSPSGNPDAGSRPPPTSCYANVGMLPEPAVQSHLHMGYVSKPNFLNPAPKKRPKTVKTVSNEKGKKMKLAKHMSPTNVGPELYNTSAVASASYPPTPVGGYSPSLQSNINMVNASPTMNQPVPVMQQAEVQERKDKWQKLQQTTLSYFSRSTFQANQQYALPKLVQLNLLPSDITKTPYLEALLRYGLSLEETRADALRKYQTHMFQVPLTHPKNASEIDVYLLHGLILSVNDLPKESAHSILRDLSYSSSTNHHEVDDVLPPSPSMATLDSMFEELSNKLQNNMDYDSDSMQHDSRTHLQHLWTFSQSKRPITPPISLQHIPSKNSLCFLERINAMELLSSLPQRQSLPPLSPSEHSHQNTATSKLHALLSMEEFDVSTKESSATLYELSNSSYSENLTRPPTTCLMCHHRLPVNDMCSLTSAELNYSSNECTGGKMGSHPMSSLTFCSSKCEDKFRKYYRFWKYNFNDTRVERCRQYCAPLFIHTEINVRRKATPSLKSLISPPSECLEQGEKMISCSEDKFSTPNCFHNNAADFASRKRKRIFRGSEMQCPADKARKREIDALNQLGQMGPGLCDKSTADIRICVLCRRSGQEAKCGRFIPFAMDQGWLHQNCAAWSLHSKSSPPPVPPPFTIQPTNAPQQSSETIIIRESHLKSAMDGDCDVCSKSGAGRECELCGQRYHYPCAIEHSREITLDQDGRFYCPEHCFVPVEERDRATPADILQRSMPRVILPDDKITPLLGKFRRSTSAKDSIIRIGSLLIEEIGQLPTRHIYSGQFHSRSYIYPVGFRSIRLYWSMHRPMRRCAYTCEIGSIQDSDTAKERPLFRVTVKEDLGTAEDCDWKPEIICHTSCSTLWDGILQRIRQVQSQNQLYRMHPHRTCGERMFGLDEPIVRLAIESLPGSLSLNTYEFVHPRLSLLGDLPVYEDELGCSRARPCPGTHFQRREAYTFPIQSQFLYLGAVNNSHLNLSVKQIDSTDQEVSLLVKQRKQLLAERLQALIREEWETHVYIAPSRVQGFGVFAARDFDVGQFIIRYVGEFLRPNVARQRLRHYRQRHQCAYFLRLNDDVIVDATVTGGAGRYVQHSCQPNCSVECYDTPSGKHIVFVAKCKIVRTEELTFSYGRPLDDSSHH